MALDVMEHNTFFNELKFRTAVDGRDCDLHYYFYNWKCSEMKPEHIGLILL